MFMQSAAQITTMLTCTCETFAAVAFIAITFICHSKCTDKWQHEMSMDPKGNFKLFWNFRNENITIEIEVRTKGYVALGFSPHGGMKGADIVTGWVKGSQVFLEDRYATGNIEPLVDDIQDYELIFGFENDTHTVLQFTRQLSSCDQQDFAIMDMITHVIYAWGTDDPVSATTIEYHGAQNRGTKAFNLFSPNVDPFQLTDDMIPLDFQMPKVNLPPEETTYWCQYFKFPETGVKKHGVGMQIIVQPGNENVVHHITVSQCLDQFSAKLESLLNGPGVNCGTVNAAFAICPHLVIGWNTGNPNETLPPHVGFPLGEIDKPTYFMVSIHYNNPSKLSDIVDQTTVRFMITEKLRKYDGGLLALIPNAAFGGIIIPPKQENFTVATILPSECTKKMLPVDGINIMIAFLHGHLALRKIYARHFRNDVELPPIDYDNDYDFDFQHRSNILKEVKLLPGDFIAIHCEYNTMDRTNFTMGGLGAHDEMCNAFFVYYPLVNLTYSVKSASQQNLMHIFKTADSKQMRNNISTGYEMTKDEFVKTFDASILTKEDISALSYLQTYSRMQGICFGRDGEMEFFDVEYTNNDTSTFIHQQPGCENSIKQT